MVVMIMGGSVSRRSLHADRCACRSRQAVEPARGPGPAPLPDLRPARQRGARRRRARLGVPQRGVPGVRAGRRVPAVPRGGRLRVSHHLLVLLRLPDPDARYAAVRLRSDLTSREFARDQGEWRLALDELPPVERLEYQLEVEHDDGGTESLLDPGNPHTVAGAFGDKSVLLLPTYRPPAWLDQPHAEGQVISLTTRGRGMSVDADLWCPADAAPREPLPLLVAHDGPEYDRLADPTPLAAVKIPPGDLPRPPIAPPVPGQRREGDPPPPRPR